MGGSTHRGALVGASVWLRCWFQQGAGLGRLFPSTPAAPGLSPVEPGLTGTSSNPFLRCVQVGAIVVHDLQPHRPATCLAVGATTSPVGGVAYGQPRQPSGHRFLGEALDGLGPTLGQGRRRVSSQ